MDSAHSPKSDLGFTLVEVLIVIAIVAIISVTVAIIINPLDLAKRTRDANRLNDLETLQKAISTLMSDSRSDPFIFCAPPVGWPEVPYATCASDTIAGSRLINGQGWVRIDFTAQDLVHAPALPIDPVNALDTGLYYKYCSDGYDYEINAKLESNKYQSLMTNDGGNSPDRYEIGTNLQISTCN